MRASPEADTEGERDWGVGSIIADSAILDVDREGDGEEPMASTLW